MSNTAEIRISSSSVSCLPRYSAFFYRWPALWSGMGIVRYAKAAAFAGVMAASAALGHYAALDRDFHIERAGAGVFVYSRSAGTAARMQPLFVYRGDVYAGGSAHQLQGIRAAAHAEGRAAMQPRIEGLEKKVGELENRNTVNDVRHTVDKIVWKIKEAWYNIKEEFR